MLQTDAGKIELRDRTLVVIVLFCSFRPTESSSNVSNVFNLRLFLHAADMSMWLQQGSADRLEVAQGSKDRCGKAQSLLKS